MSFPWTKLYSKMSSYDRSRKGASQRTLHVLMRTESRETGSHWIPVSIKGLIPIGMRSSLSSFLRSISPSGSLMNDVFKTANFIAYLQRKKINWPLLDSGNPKMDDETFSVMSLRHPEIIPLKELRSTLSKMRLKDLSIGEDGRNRTLLSPFRSKTGRNQPSSSKFIFGASSWLRGLVKPEEGMSLAYIDWSQQEYGIAAALSGDENMLKAYLSGDPYLAFAIQAGQAPEDATKKSTQEIRNQFKAAVLAVQYGMGAESLALRIGESKARGGNSSRCTGMPIRFSGGGRMLRLIRR